MILVEILYWAVLVIVYFLVIYRLDAVKKDRHALFVLLLFGLLLVVYLRFVVYAGPLPWADEVGYDQHISRVTEGTSVPISGPGYVAVIIALVHFTRLSNATVMTIVALLVGSLGLSLIYAALRLCLPVRSAFKSVIYSLVTSHFLFALWEGRPQQFGMILVPLAALLYYHSITRKRHWPTVAAFTITSVLCFYAHILSFIILQLAVLSIWGWLFAHGRAQWHALVLPASVLTFALWRYFAANSVYTSNYGAIRWSFSNIIGLFSPTVWFFLIVVLLVVALIFLWSVRVYGIVRQVRFWISSPLAMVVGMAAVALGFAIQFMIDPGHFGAFYHSSLLYFILFQVGNLSYGILFFLGIRALAQNDALESPFVAITCGLMAVGVLALAVSTMYSYGWNNWLIRVLNYWVVFASPIAASVSTPRSAAGRLAIAALLATGGVLSVLNATRDPLLFRVV